MGGNGNEAERNGDQIAPFQTKASPIDKISDQRQHKDQDADDPLNSQKEKGGIRIKWDHSLVTKPRIRNVSDLFRTLAYKGYKISDRRGNADDAPKREHIQCFSNMLFAYKIII